MADEDDLSQNTATGIDRRRLLKRAGIVSVATAGCAYWWREKLVGYTPPVLTHRQSETLQSIAENFMRQFNVPALSVAIARHGRFIYSNAIGYLDQRTVEHATETSVFRIASVSKTLTSVAIFTLIDKGKLSLSDHIFGSRGILSEFTDVSGTIDEITVHHLLTHTSGAWDNKNNDPMFQNPQLGHPELIAWTLANIKPIQSPGKVYAYSNFGYCLLGRVIERISGLPYSEYVQTQVLRRCGVTNMKVATNRYSERTQGEAVYYGSEGDGNPYGMNISRLDSAGGWIASASDLVRVAMHVDGFSYKPNILSNKSITAMTQPLLSTSNSACGWFVNRFPNWWHFGSLPGTTSLLVRTASGLCWSAIANTRSEGIDSALDRTIWQMVKAIPDWHA